MEVESERDEATKRMIKNRKNHIKRIGVNRKHLLVDCHKWDQRDGGEKKKTKTTANQGNGR